MGLHAMSNYSKPMKISDGAARELRRAMFAKGQSKRVQEIKIKKRKKLGTRGDQEGLGIDTK
jgi:hypothetical protein